MQSNNVICAIAKKENAYINEWCHHHLNLGFSHIYIYDNNDLNYPDVKACISNDIKDKVTFFDIRGQKSNQTNSYTEFYQKYKNTFNWCAFIDLDEFIFLKKWLNINDMLNDISFKDYDIITLAWYIYDDNDIIERDETKSIIEIFTRQKKDGTYQIQQKEIVRGNNNNLLLKHAHSANYSCSIKRLTCDNKLTGDDYTAYEYTYNAWINHYKTKSLSEFIKYKKNVTSGYGSRIRDTFKYFWDINKKTPDKLNYLKEKGIKDE